VIVFDIVHIGSC